MSSVLFVFLHRIAVVYVSKYVLYTPYTYKKTTVYNTYYLHVKLSKDLSYFQ